MAAPVGLIHHDPAVVPGTHALVIGVGTYPHLQGGTARAGGPTGWASSARPRSPPVA